MTGLLDENIIELDSLTKINGGQPKLSSFCFKNMETNKRPKLDDPVEWAIIRSMYFNDTATHQDPIEPIEKLERIESKERFNNKSSR